MFHVKPSDPYSLKIFIFYFKLRIYKYTLLKPTLLQPFFERYFKKVIYLVIDRGEVS